jgi:hypothetical protein
MFLRIYDGEVKTIDRESFIQRLGDAVIIDIGYGDGKFLIKQAIDNPKKFYVGIDSSVDLLKHNFKKIRKKKIKNLLFVVSSIQNFPDIKVNASKVYINFPWSDLLSMVVKQEAQLWEKLNNLVKRKGLIEIYLTYNKKYDGKFVEKYELPDLSLKFFKKIWRQKIAQYGFSLFSLERLGSNFIPQTSWGKELLNQSRNRVVYKIIVIKNREIVYRREYQFSVWGHPNITAKHSKTIELTKSKTLGLAGSCILGVNANFDLKKLKNFKGKVSFIFKVCDEKKDLCLEQKVKCIVNESYADNNELVLRKSDFRSPRTFGIKLNHGASKINKNIVDYMKDKNSKMTVIVKEGWV